MNKIELYRPIVVKANNTTEYTTCLYILYNSSVAIKASVDDTWPLSGPIELDIGPNGLKLILEEIDPYLKAPLVPDITESAIFCEFMYGFISMNLLHY
jgi:hypothetical protein